MRRLHLLPNVCLALASAAALLPAGCSREKADEVVLYSSVDPQYLQPVMEAFEKATGVEVLYAGDTEATKTTGLAMRLIEEHRVKRGRADVWWSSEPFWTIRLAGEGVLEPYTSDVAEASIEGGWPRRYRGEQGTWYGLALRARVYVYNTEMVSPEEAPRTPADLLDERFKGRIGMARPQFGTTRGHMAAMLAEFGEEAFRAWLEGLKANGLRLYDGNMSVVRAVSSGEILVGLADSDDVWAGQRNGWPVALAYEANGAKTGAGGPPTIDSGMGALMLPNTIALVADAPNKDNAQRFIDFALSEQVERILAESDSHNVPVHPDLAAEFAQYAVPEPAEVDFQKVAAAGDRAMEICAEVVGDR
jgi:iron(III) transport system substrate-binding protein